MGRNISSLADRNRFRLKLFYTEYPKNTTVGTIPIRWMPPDCEITGREAVVPKQLITNALGIELSPADHLSNAYLLANSIRYT